MEQRIKECLEGKASTEYILPFFWQHGEAHSVLAEEMDAIQMSGIREFCVESRTHEQFGEEKWWQDFGFILQEAQARGMRVWLLDDKRFPTGYANNYIADHPALRAIRLRMEFRDFAGPMKGAAILPISLDEDESFVSIMAYERKQRGDVLAGEGIPLLSCLRDGLLWFDIPAGYWRVYYVIRTRRAGMEGRGNYIDMLSEASCKAMLQGVYEPHYEHFGKYFGNTFVGFFSDEPGFMNEDNYYDATLGREDVDLPWNDGLAAVLAEKSGLSEEQVMALLPALWHAVEGYTAIMRECYMDAVTEGYRDNFSRMLGNWCRDHGVMYIGHIIEDQNAHQRLGRSAGHFFRAMDGQDMAGCDIVLHQVIPGQADFEHTAALRGNRAEPAFFHYTLPKLAASQAHIQPLKKGRAMCEVYGAFGWATGVPAMKYLTDLMLVGGINHFVPHAFSPRYPDADCPPHFYAGGRNPQFAIFGELMGYMQRMCHALSGGVHQADVAVYYNAEAEWAGGRRMLQQEVCKELARHQIDFDLLPQDTLCENAFVKGGRLCVHEESYGALIVPYSQYLPGKLLKVMRRLADVGIPVWFIDGYPNALREGHDEATGLRNCSVIPFAELVKTIRDHVLWGIRAEEEYPSLRCFHIRRNGYDLFMLWNEDILAEIDTWVSFPAREKGVFYDAWNNRIASADQRDNRVRVRLAPAEAVLLIFGSREEGLAEYDYGAGRKNVLALEWQVSLCGTGDKGFVDCGRKELKSLASELPDFSGVIRYEADWQVADPDGYYALELEQVGETARLWINDCFCGTEVQQPYRFWIKDKLTKGENHIRIEVVPNLAYRERDMFSTYLPLPPMGLIGTVYGVQS